MLNPTWPWLGLWGVGFHMKRHYSKSFLAMKFSARIPSYYQSSVLNCIARKVLV